MRELKYKLTNKRIEELKIEIQAAVDNGEVKIESAEWLSSVYVDYFMRNSAYEQESYLQALLFHLMYAPEPVTRNDLESKAYMEDVIEEILKASENL